MNIKRSIKIMGVASGLSMAIVAGPSQAILGGSLTDPITGITDTLNGSTGGLLSGLNLGGAGPLEILAGGDILGGTSILGDLTGGLAVPGGVGMFPGTLANVGGSGDTLAGVLELGGLPGGAGGLGVPGIPNPDSFSGGTDGVFGAVTEVVAAGPTAGIETVTAMLEQTPVRTCAEVGQSVNLQDGSVHQQHNVLAIFGGDELWSYDRDENGNICLAQITRSGGNGDNLGIIPEAQNIVNGGSFTFVDGQGNEQQEDYVFMVNPGPGLNDTGVASGLLDTLGATPAPGDALLGGNSTLSVFRIGRNGVELTDIVDIGGPNGRSVAVDSENQRVFTVAAGSQFELYGTEICVINENIRGFDLDASTGQLSMIPGSTVETADCAGDPGSLDISSDGRFLVVAQRNTTFATIAGPEPDRVEIFEIDQATGVPSAPVVSITAPPESGDELGDSPFGGRVLVENFNGEISYRYYSTFGFGQAPNNGDNGSFAINPDGSLSGIGGEGGSGVIRTRGSDNCWNAISNPTADDPSVRYMYSSAFFDSALMQHPIDRATGELLDDEAFENGRSAVRSSRPENGEVYLGTQGGLDVAITRAGDNQQAEQFVYVNNNPTPPPTPVDAVDARLTNIEAFRVNSDGTLTRLPNTRINSLTSRHQGLWAM